jgi:hypothetical protein
MRSIVQSMQCHAESIRKRTTSTVTRQELRSLSAMRMRIFKDVLRLTLDLAALNVVADGLWTPSVDLAARGESSAENFLHGTLEVLGHGLVPHRSCDLNDLVERNRLGVLDILFLLPVSRWLLERPDD